MSRVDLFNGATIKIEGTNTSYHTYEDWGLYITNTDCIGEPKQYTRYIEVPGRNGLLDLSEAIAGRQVYTSREIKIQVAGPKEKTTWTAVISAVRNAINGKIVNVIFDDDTNYFWRGRVEIKDFESALDLGKLTIRIPTADPYKYTLTSSTDPWIWDTFNFETGIITYIGAITVDGRQTTTIPSGHMPTSPELVASNVIGALTVTCNGATYTLLPGTNRIPAIIVGGDNDVDLTFTGNAIVQVVYRSGSL